MRNRFFVGLLALLLAAGSGLLQAADAGTEAAIARQPGLVKSEFILDNPPFPTSHASTIVESKGVLLAAWFGGTRERALDVSIWLSRHDGARWSDPEQVANGVHDDIRVRYPCWNPVLFRPANGPLCLFYKEGPSPESWWGMVKVSYDNGQSWTIGKKLPRDIAGPVKNKPVELEDGSILCGSSSENEGWRVHMERTKNPLKTWSRTEALNRAIDFGAIQPTVLVHATNSIQILCRTRGHKVAESWSQDTGFTWSRMVLTDLPNPNSGIDAVKLKDGRSLLVYNHSEEGRNVLNVSVSPDGRRWQGALSLENSPNAEDEFSYPAVIQTEDKMVHVTYTWKRQKIRHVIIDPSKLEPKEIVGGRWPW